MTISVAIADEMDIALFGMEAILRPHPHILITGFHPYLDALLDACRDTAPDVILLSDRIGASLDALTLVEQVRRAAPKARLVVMSNLPDGQIVHELFALGVSGYLYRGDELCEVLLDAIHTVLAGRPYLSPTANAEYLMALHAGRAAWPLDAEAREVLRLMAQGYRPQEIALMRRVPVRRVYWVNDKLRQRFGAETNEQLMVRAAAGGVCALDFQEPGIARCPP